MVLSRFCSINGLQEAETLTAGLDFRLPQYRRAVFLRFYDFHIRYRSHPGCVYYLFPYMTRKLGLDREQQLWLAFINGNTQNPVMSYLIMKEFPDLASINHDNFKKWFDASWSKLDFDIDRRRQKKLLPDAVKNYKEIVDYHGKGSQEAMFNEFIRKDKTKSNFKNIWSLVREGFTGFGRLSSFSYLEYLRIMGLDIECDDLFLEDYSGSMSHRNGILKVIGRDELETWRENPSFIRQYTDEEIEWLRKEAQSLLQDAREFSRKNKNPYLDDVGYFTIESALCTYKGWFRKDRRYSNVYNDMLYNRIKKAESLWENEDFMLFWQARKACLPKYLRLEDCPGDPGLSKPKQNHYRLTGEPIMMENDFPEFRNSFSEIVKAKVINL